MHSIFVVPYLRFSTVQCSTLKIFLLFSFSFFPLFSFLVPCGRVSSLALTRPSRTCKILFVFLKEWQLEFIFEHHQ